MCIKDLNICYLYRKKYIEFENFTGEKMMRFSYEKRMFTGSTAQKNEVFH